MSFKYNGIEFPTEEELVEYIRDIEGSDVNIGYIREVTEKEYKGNFVDKFAEIEKMVDAAEIEERRIERGRAKKERDGKYVIYALSCGSKMYVSKNNKYTFELSEALVTDFETARKKAFFMSQRGHNQWKYLKLK